MVKYLVFSCVVLAQAIALGKNVEKSEQLFGTTISWKTESQKTSDQISESVTTLIKKEQAAYDPDCFYRPVKDGECKTNDDIKNITVELDKLSADYKQETDGSFDVSALKENKKYRDYGGMAQGYVLETLSKKFKTGWFSNFSGDIYVAPKTKMSDKLLIADPEFEDIPVAEVKMKAGWMLGSSSPKFGARIRNPKTGKTLESSDFQKIVLFAKSDFSGARLDSWSTALIVGGLPLLNNLWNLEKYKNQWAYYFIDKGNNIVCSKNIKCLTVDEKPEGLVKIPW